ncbi:heavy metal translocating P-type ATPase [Peloplasma aerotolerans]|uniref:Heavy metal translocating P-type ATPase n=1 Tax=Peloplasma aerotolerans TaxID=3044389 RepID=A0AAW6U9D8_9MOLU|nr:heavy metal translocating P-type ATPase [Mariniplasma sp. M4Ah]MDI6452681.1 heavy metal translocating P-type ATPase [Mariniplasma sp. M4Ah]MDR4968106.1 heavy metal translocating P-type ATPase [Acholeplasmataceae bacterium]
MRKKYNIKNMDCANCALKIEKKYSELDGVKTARVDFGREKVFIEGDIEQYDSKSLQKIARKIESNIIVKDENEKLNEKTTWINKIELPINIMGVVLVVIALIFNFIDSLVISQTLLVIIYITSYFFIGGKVIIRALTNLLRGKIFDENFLMTLATIGALAINDYLEAVAVMLFYRVGEYLQDRSIDKSRKNIKDLMDIKPLIAHLQKGMYLTEVRPEDLEINQIIIVKPGEKIPVDGIVIEGNSSVDASSLTGESMPKDITKGQEVISGSLNINAPLTVKVLKKYQDSTVARILDFVENNANKKAKTEKFITRFAKYYTPIVVGFAIILAFAVPFIISNITGSTYQDEFAIYFRRALIFLVISCPCALVLSIPLSFFAGIGASSKQGILFKSGSDLEMMTEINHFIFDKTGTLTKGRFEVSKIVSNDKDKLLEYAAHVESQSNHPISQSILSAYNQQIKNKVDDIKEIFGKGIQAIYNNKQIFVGNAIFMQENGLNYQNPTDVGTIIHVATHQEYLGYLVIKDQIKEYSKSLVEQLNKQGKSISMVTGDQESSAKDIGKQLGIDSIYFNCLPEDKVRIVSELVKKDKVAFIGDGINDAPVLTVANLGIAMGVIGSDAAIEASDAVIMNDNPSQILVAQKIAQKTMKIVVQNIIMALGVKTIVLILGALGFANLWLAIFADVGVSILAVFNAMRIFRK